jgi:hypothetical protein
VADLEAIGGAIVTSLRALRLAQRCAGCGRVVTEVGGFDRGRAWCVPCSDRISRTRGAAA